MDTDLDFELEQDERARPPRNLMLAIFPIAAAGLLVFTTHNALVSWIFGLSLIAWCAVTVGWLMLHDNA